MSTKEAKCYCEGCHLGFEAGAVYPITTTAWGSWTVIIVDVDHAKYCSIVTAYNSLDGMQRWNPIVLRNYLDFYSAARQA